MTSDDEAMTWLDGTPYQAEGVVGRGGMAVVLAARHRTLGRSLCVKVLRAEASHRPDLIDRFRLEAQSLAKLGGGSHKNLLQVSDFGETPGGRWYLASERLYGRTLDEERRARGPIPWGEACALVLQALAGLAVAHDAGIVHRDIKPANLFVQTPETPNGPRVVKVLDFGVAQLLEWATADVERPHIATAAGTVIGTPRYMAPEQLSQRPVDKRTDVFAMALVLYALLTGKSPHAGLDGDALLVAQLTEPLGPLPASVPKAVAALVMRASSKSPDERPEDAGAFARALEEAVKPAALATPAPAPARRPPSTGPRGTERFLAAPAALPLFVPTTPLPPELQARAREPSPSARAPSEDGTTSPIPARAAPLPRVESVTAAPSEDGTEIGTSKRTFVLVVVGATVVLTTLFVAIYMYLRGGA